MLTSFGVLECCRGVVSRGVRVSRRGEETVGVESCGEVTQGDVTVGGGAAHRLLTPADTVGSQLHAPPLSMKLAGAETTLRSLALSKAQSTDLML